MFPRDEVRLTRSDQIMIKRFLRDQSGATAVEYGLLITIFSIGLVSALTSVGTAIRQKFIMIAATLGTS